MTQFIQLHFLTSYPPSNLNRDDLGRPKTAFMGGINRLRISSQSLKRAWRTSDFFQSTLAGNLGVRTKRMGRDIYQRFKKAGIAEDHAVKWTKLIAGQFGKGKTIKDKKSTKDEEVCKIESKAQEESKFLAQFDIEQLVHISPEEQQAINHLVEYCIKEKKEPEKEQLNLLRKTNSAADIACFGRMLADDPHFNVEAAIQVAHAITTHGVDVEDDYFSAVDDLNDGIADAGAGHIGASEYGSGLFYHYVCINYDLLKDNLNGNAILANQTLKALVETVTKVTPSGKQNSFASRAYTSYLLVEKGDKQPRSLSVAFLKPVNSHDLLNESIKVLEDRRDKLDKVYGPCYDAYQILNAHQGEGSLVELLNFIAEN